MPRTPMIQRRIRHLALALVAATSLLTGGCLSSIDSSCSSLAETHCGNCFSCAADVDGISGAELCDVPAGAGTSRADCENALADRCGSQARTLQDPFPELDDCQPKVDSETCDDLVQRETLDQPAAPLVCRRFL